MNEQLRALFPWLGAQTIQYLPSENRVYNFVTDKGDVDTAPLFYGFMLENNPVVFVPESYLQKGITYNNQQIYSPNVLREEFLSELQNLKLYSVEELAKITGQDKFVQDYKAGKHQGEKGYLIPSNLVNDYVSELGAYQLGPIDGFSWGQIAGIAKNQQGQNVYSVEVGGKPNAYGFISPGEKLPQGGWYDPGKKWYETTLGKIGIALIVGGTAGLMLGGTAAAGGAAAGGAAAGGSAAGGAAAGGTAAGLGGAAGTGITAGTAATGIGGGALGTGLTVGTTASGIGGGALGTGLTAGAASAGLAAGAGASSAAVPGLLEGATFPTQGLQVPPINSSQVALIPEGTALAGQGLQVPTLPGLSAMGGGTGLAVGVPGGTVTQLGFVPTGATPVLGDPASFINNPDVLGNTVFTTDYLAAPGAAAGMSATDALRLLNQARGLLGAGQNPIVPQQQGLPQGGGGGGARGVDYSGLLSLLQLQAGLPGVAPLTAPAQLRQIYQPTLLPNTLSLLG